jgi:hypothetical protein
VHSHIRAASGRSEAKSAVKRPGEISIEAAGIVGTDILADRLPERPFGCANAQLTRCVRNPACDGPGANPKMGTVTSSPGPDESGRHAPRRPDSTDPDLAPLPPMTDSGPLPSYAEEPAEVAGAVDTDVLDHDADVDDVEDDVDVDREAEEDGLQGPREPAAQAVAARLSRRPRDMVISIGLLLVVVFALFGLYRCLGGDEPTTVDAGPVYAEARDAKAFPVLQPSGLPDGWDSVSATYQPQSGGAILRIGMTTPSGKGVQLIEGNVQPDILLTRELGDSAQATGDVVDLGGRQWQVYNARDGERAYVWQEPERTVIVIGRATEEELKQLATALK